MYVIFPDAILYTLHPNKSTRPTYQSLTHDLVSTLIPPPWLVLLLLISLLDCQRRPTPQPNLPPGSQSLVRSEAYFWLNCLDIHFRHCCWYVLRAVNSCPAEASLYLSRLRRVLSKSNNRALWIGNVQSASWRASKVVRWGQVFFTWKRRGLPGK